MQQVYCKNITFQKYCKMLYRNKFLMITDQEIDVFPQVSFLYRPSWCTTILIRLKSQYLITEKNLNIFYMDSSEIRIHLGIRTHLCNIYTYSHRQTHTYWHTCLDQWLSKCCPQSTSTASPENLIEIQICMPHTRPAESEAQVMLPSNLCFNIGLTGLEI